MWVAVAGESEGASMSRRPPNDSRLASYRVEAKRLAEKEMGDALTRIFRSFDEVRPRNIRGLIDCEEDIVREAVHQVLAREFGERRGSKGTLDSIEAAIFHDWMAQLTSEGLGIKKAVMSARTELQQRRDLLAAEPGSKPARWPPLPSERALAERWRRFLRD